MSNFKPLPLAAALFILGILFSHNAAVGFLTVVLLAILLFVSFLFLKRRQNFLFYIISAALVFNLGAFSYINFNHLPQNHISRLLENPKKAYFIQGVITSSPEYFWKRSGKRGVSFYFKSLIYKEDEAWVRTEGFSKVNIKENEQEYRYGDRIVIFGKLKKPRSAANPGEFDYARYLKTERIYTLIDIKSDDDMLIIKRERPFFIKTLIFNARRNIEELIKTYLPNDEAAILSAMLIGRRADIPKGLSEHFIETGTAHIISISGLHVTLMAGILFFILKLLRIPRNISSIVIICLLIIYAILADARPPIIRSVIMIAVYLLGFALKRDFDIYSALAMAAIIILIFNPLQIFSAGFTLSFACVFFICYLTPRFETHLMQAGFFFDGKSNKALFYFDKALHYTLRLFTASLAVTIGVLPLIAYYFNIISPISIIANIFIVPFSGIILFLGVLFAALGSLFGPMAYLIGYFLHISLLVFIKAIEFFSTAAFGYFYVPDTPLYIVAAYYISLFAAIYRKRLNLNWPKVLIVGLLILDLFLWRHMLIKKEELRATFLALKKSDTVFLEFPDGKTALINSGIARGPQYNEADSVVLPFIFSRGKGDIDIFILTHSDFSHIVSAISVLKKIKVRYFISPDLDEADKACQRLMYIINSKDIRWIHLKSGLRVGNMGGAEILIRHPSMLKLSYKDASFEFLPAKNHFYIDNKPEDAGPGLTKQTQAVTIVTDGKGYSVKELLKST